MADKEILAQMERNYARLRKADRRAYRDSERDLSADSRVLQDQADREVTIHRQETTPTHAGGLHNHPPNCDCPAHHTSGGMLGDGRVHLRDLQKRGVGRKGF